MAAMSDRLSGAMAFKALQPLDGHGFADLVMMPRRPAAQLAPLHRVDHRTLARSPIRDQLHRRLQPFCYLRDCSGCFRLERLPSGPCTYWKAPLYSRRTHRADVADSGRSGWGKAVNRVEGYRTAAARRAVLTFGSPSPAFGRSRRRAVLAWQARNSVWAVVLQWNLAVSSAPHWLWSSTSWARQGISLFARVSGFLTSKCGLFHRKRRSVQRLEIRDQVGAVGVVLQSGVDHCRVRHHHARIGKVFIEGGGVPGDAELLVVGGVVEA